MIQDFLIPLLVVGLGELGDKTNIAVFLLASKIKNPTHLFVGSMFAFLIVDGVAILAGKWVTTLVPVHIIKIFGGVLFILLGLWTLKNSKEEKKQKTWSYHPMIVGFLLIFLSEWGDKTQFATAILATRYQPWLVLGGVMTGLAIASLAAIWLGKFLSQKVEEKLLNKIAGVLFIVMGIVFLLSNGIL
ncbi:TPA: TMEM165/GDT1 family protein [Candidatus Woesearchaeota archaeon]|nr:MAG: hypothetical protein QT07_C0003G0016 [archaeon GW2011_AR16]HIG95804.1 TMEM165/GDT1 family protein [Candidatus Woesearchaeota archaeon]HIH47568.1 TMEM165/GDT1 family protein [Candidatus Woesearchaeota archaeon]HII88590.1 TMEM165/GDT1 family protein [Candidatus Woesearchaeota archaeon]